MTTLAAKQKQESKSRLDLLNLLECAEYHERLANLHGSFWKGKEQSRPREASKHHLQMLKHKEWSEQIRRLAG